MSRFWNDHTRQLEPYVPGEQPQDRQYIKLNTNENPYPPSPMVTAAIEAANDHRLKLYPDPLCKTLNDAIADYYGLSPAQIFTGNGSDEVLAFIWQAFLGPGTTVAYPDITYSFYPVYSQMFMTKERLVPLTESFAMEPTAYKGHPEGIVIANPNAPTGMLLELEAIESLLKAKADTLVVVDEAYIDFGGQSALPLIEKYDNLLVVQTMSKSRALAGMRIGFAMGHPALIEGLNRVKNSINSYTMDRLALVAGAAAMADKAYFDQTCKRIMATREWTAKELTRLGFKVLPSKANFLFASPPDGDSQGLFERLKAKGILVRYFNKPRIADYLRISIGTDEEMATLIQVLEKTD